MRSNKLVIKVTGPENQKVGEAGQQQGAGALRRAGVEQVEHIGTPIKRIPHPDKKWAALGYARIIYGERVAGDHRGVLPGGRSVLAEIKTVFEGNLLWKHFKPHQPDKLTAHAEAGGLSVVVWVGPRGAMILRWPIPGFRKGKGLTLDQAEALDLADLRQFINVADDDAPKLSAKEQIESVANDLRMLEDDAPQTYSVKAMIEKLSNALESGYDELDETDIGELLNEIVEGV